MKAKQRLFLILIILPFTLQAQEALLYADRLWTMVQVQCQEEGNVYSSHYLKPGPDTLIDGNIYTHLQYSDDEPQSLWYDYGGFIRETQDGKVYYRLTGIKESLIYDFSASLGDTVVIINPELIPEPLHMVVIEEDSVLLEDGWHRRMKLEDNDYPGVETWIEGVGSVSGLVKSGLAAFGSSCGGFELLCTSNTGFIIYKNSKYPSCWYVSTKIEYPYQADVLKLYPNPVQNLLNIEGDFLYTGEMYNVRLIDYTGKVVVEKEQTSRVLDLSGLSRGVYVIQINTSAAFYSQKILKY